MGLGGEESIEAAAAGDYSPHIGDIDVEAEGGIPADAATLNSDAAVGGSVGGGSGERRRGGSSSQQSSGGGAPVPEGGGTPSPLHDATARQRHQRKRALSTATIESSGSIAAVAAGNTGGANVAAGGGGGGRHPSGGGSLMNSSISGGGAEHSIVSFGLNFNFDDTTSSPSNSDSGEGAVHDGKGGCGGEGSNSDDDNNNNNTNGGGGNAHHRKNATGDTVVGGGSSGSMIKTGGGDDDRKKNKKSHHKHNRRGGSGAGGAVDALHRQHGLEVENENGSSTPDDGGIREGDNRTTSVTFVPEATDAARSRRTSGEEGSSTSSGSDSSMNDINGGNASGGSNSGNDGSSGGKSTISSLTTSSNQEWMAAQNDSTGVGASTSSEAQAVAATIVTTEAKSSRSTAQVTWNMGVEGGDVPSKMKDATSGKKRKKTTGGMNIENTKTDGGNEDDDGYKTDEEWGGSGGPNHQDCGTNNVLPGRGPLATHKGSSSLIKANNNLSSAKSLVSSSEGPPMKQARFLMDHQNLSSLSGSDSAVVATGASSTLRLQTHGSSKSSPAALTMSSSNPPNSQGSSPQNCESAQDRGPAQGGGSAVEPTKRKERNAREKERSCRIARQIDDLRALLSRGGVTVNKTTKSSVLAEAANYIDILQQQQAQWEIERQTLMQQMQQLGVMVNPAMNQLNLLQKEVPMSTVDAGVYPMAAQQAVAFPQHLALGLQQVLPSHAVTLPINPPELAQPQTAVNAINPNDYKFVFNNSSVGMAIASLGGAFTDCNPIFCHLSEYTKEEVCAMTIFNMTSRQDLQHAFDLISQMITPTLDGTAKGDEKPSIVLRGAMKNRNDLGLSISLIKGEHGVAKCFSVTLVRILSMENARQDTTLPIEMELPQVPNKQQKNIGFGISPAYTAG